MIYKIKIILNDNTEITHFTTHPKYDGEYLSFKTLEGVHYNYHKHCFKEVEINANY